MRVAVFSDVHGNLHALDAVLERMQQDRPDLIVNLGDLVSGPFDPRGSADRLMSLDCATVAGNHERQLVEGAGGFSDSFARPLLSALHMDWIGGLPGSLFLAGGEIFACHGSPAGGDLEYLLEDVQGGRPVLDLPSRIRPRLAGCGAARVVLCGHTHIPRIVSLDGTLVVNPGSVGMPAYRGRSPVPHAMQAGSPHARYGVLEQTRAGWQATLHAVRYDTEAAARQAEQAGAEAAAHAIRHGWLPEPPVCPPRGWERRSGEAAQAMRGGSAP